MVIEIPFRGVTAVSGSENPRRSRGFTIESLIGTDLERSSKRDSVCSQPAHHHPSLPPPPPPPPVGHVSSNGTLPSPLLPLGINSLSSSSSSASSPSSSSSSSLSSSSVSPNGNHHNATTSGPVTSSSLTTSSSLLSKNPLKCTADHTINHITHHHSKNTNSIINSSNYSGSNNENRSTNNNCTSSVNSSSTNNITTSHTNNNKINCNKQNSYNSISRSPSPITTHLSETGQSNSNSNINSTTTSSNDNNNNINGTKSDDSPVNSRLVSAAHHHHYPQQQTPLGLVTHSIDKSLLEDKERFSHHQQHHHSPQSQNQQQNYHHHHHHHSPPIPGSSPLGHTGTTGGSPGLHYPLKCVQNTEDYYRGAASGFTPVRLCNHPLGSAVAAAAAAAAAGTAPSWTGVLPPTSPAAAAAAAAAAMGPVNMSLYRDHSLFNPWMFARCAGYLGHRYPVNHDGAFLLPPYRKPKRIRTAFSPAQLLQLEEAFEKNHYVVGQERKELAADLKLTETQVKVWFQNRRTKHKRMKAEEEATSGSGGSTREEPSSSSRARSKEMDIDPTGMEPIEYDGSDENSDSEPMGIDT